MQKKKKVRPTVSDNVYIRPLDGAMSMTAGKRSFCVATFPYACVRIQICKCQRFIQNMKWTSTATAI